MRENGPVWVSNGDVLGESEADGVVTDGERRELHGVDGDLRVLGFENGEVNDKNYYYKEDQENRCYNTRS